MQRTTPFDAARPAWDKALRRVSAEAGLAAGVPGAQTAVKAGLPAFLVDDDDTDAAAARPAGPSGDHEEPHGSALAPVAAVSGTQRLLRLGFLGRPNAGKSTLVNRLAGGTVSAVSVRTETTRRPVLGALTLGDTQILMYDTPGVWGVRSDARRPSSARVASAWSCIQECDLLAFLVDASSAQVSQEDMEIAASLAARPGGGGAATAPVAGWRARPAVLVLTQVDKLGLDGLHQLVPMAARLGRHGAFDAVLALSARHAYGTPALLSLLLERARTAPWELAAGQPAELTWPELAAELVREKIYWAHTHEVPYAAGTRCAEFLEGLDGRLKVVVEVTMPNARLQRIVFGERGERAARIQARVGAELAHMTRRHVDLRVTVHAASRQRA